ncbi:MAG: cytochrome c3 family protein [Planctomycetota bacterium]|jgi:hypothetical protein
MKLRTQIFIIAVLAMAMSAPLWAVHTDGGCAGCHASHNTDANSPLEVVDVPLWKGVLAPSSGFTAYTSTTLTATDVGQPDGDSLMCLSCHDGTTQTGVGVSGNNDLGRDLSDDHPISFQYTDALAGTDGELHTPSDTDSGLGGTIQADMLDSNNKIQCTSCHDVHAQHDLMALRITNTTGGLCKACHIK